ncbi:MAG: C25 family cysteine peptidase [Pirellula sp.]|jgi:hypothetical protein
MMKIRCILVSIVIVGFIANCLGQQVYSAEKKSSVLVVRPSEWSSFLTEWIRYRSNDYNIVEVDSIGNPFQLRNRLLELIHQSDAPVEAIVLCGDVLEETPNNAGSKPSIIQRRVITPSFQLETTVKLGPATTPNLATDVLFGDVDDDGCPEIAVGRIPVQNGNELKRVLARSIDYETSKDFGSWREDVHVTAGVGGFGYLADAAIETVARRYLAEGLPDRFRVNMTYASLTSPYCPDPHKLKSTYINKINQGGLFWVYIGHGWIDRLDQFQYGENLECICEPQDIPKFGIEKGPPIAIMLACYTGAIDATIPCFAKQLVTHPKGPIAVIGGSRVTMPYGLSQLAGEMIDEALVQGNEIGNSKPPLLGRVLVNAKRSIWRDDTSSEEPVSETNSTRLKTKYRTSVEQMARALSPEDHSLIAERREHVRLMNLLGDPLLKIRQPESLSIKGPNEVLAGENCVVELEIPQSGRMKIELRMHRDQLPSDLIPVGSYDGSDEKRDLMQRNYEKANNLVVWSDTIDVTPGIRTIDVPIPKNSKGKQIVWVRMEQMDGWRVGTHRFNVKRLRQTSGK